MSIARGVATTPEQAYKDRANAIKERCEQNDKIYQAPAGVLAVTVEEVESVEIKSPQGSESRHPLTAWDDSMNDNRPDDHGHIDFNEIPPGDKGACLLAARSQSRRSGGGCGSSHRALSLRGGVTDLRLGARMADQSHPSVGAAVRAEFAPLGDQ
ncbi:hypothetical protein ACWEO2_42245 [Nocardia sp. NPDC004278]